MLKKIGVLIAVILIIFSYQKIISAPSEIQKIKQKTQEKEQKQIEEINKNKIYYDFNCNEDCFIDHMISKPLFGDPTFYKSQLFNSNKINEFENNSVFITDKKLEDQNTYKNYIILGYSPTVFAFNNDTDSRKEVKSIFHSLKNNRDESIVNFNEFKKYIESKDKYSRSIPIYVPNENSVYYEQILDYFSLEMYIICNNDYPKIKEDYRTSYYETLAKNLMNQCDKFSDENLVALFEEHKSDYDDLIVIIPEYVLTYNNSDNNAYFEEMTTKITNYNKLYLYYNEKDDFYNKIINHIDLNEFGYRNYIKGNNLSNYSYFKYSQEYTKSLDLE